MTKEEFDWVLKYRVNNKSTEKDTFSMFFALRAIYINLPEEIISELEKYGEEGKLIYEKNKKKNQEEKD